MSTDFFKDSVAIATLVLALVTVVLAVGTFLTIRQNRIFREKDRKERLLNEIIDWAIDVPNYGLKEFSNLAPLFDNSRFLEIFDLNNLLGFRSLYIKGEHIIRISNNFNSKLYNAVQELGTELGNYIKYLEKPSKERMDLNMESSQRKLLSIHAIKVIEEATNIKA